MAEIPVPAGVVNTGGDWAYTEYAHGGGVANLGVEDPNLNTSQPAAGVPPATPSPDERNRILDLFRNN